MKKLALVLTLISGTIASVPAHAAPDVSGTCTQQAYELAASLNENANYYNQLAQICLAGYQQASTNRQQVISDLRSAADKYRAAKSNGTVTQATNNGFYSFTKMYSLGAAQAGMSQAELAKALH